jgi:hypothetical protein
MAMKLAAAFSLIGLGLLLLALSGLWPKLFPGTSMWTPEKAARWAEIKDRLHNLSFLVNSPRARVSMHRGPELGQAKAEYDRIKQEGEQLRAEFEAAASRPQTVATILKWSGISLAGLGVVGWYVVKNEA